MRQGATAAPPACEQSSVERPGLGPRARAVDRAWAVVSRLPRALRRGPRLSPVAGVRRGLATLGLVWEGLWLLPDPTLWPTNQESATASILVGGVFVSWFAVVLTGVGSWASLRQRFVAQVTNVALLFAAALVLLHEAQIGGTAGWQPGASLLNLACALTGLLLVMRVAIPIVIVAVFVEFGLLMADLPELPGSSDRISMALYPLYAMAMGAASVGARLGLF